MVKNSTSQLVIRPVSIFMGKEVPEGCFGSVQRSDAGMKYLALDGKKLYMALGFEASIKIVDIISEY